MDRRLPGIQWTQRFVYWRHFTTKTLVCENVFVDSIVHDVSTFHMVKERIGVDQIVAELMIHIHLGEMESVEDSIGKVLDDAVDA